MRKIIFLLSLIIVLSLGLIGYLLLAQSNIKLGPWLNFFKKEKNIDPLSQAIFPISEPHSNQGVDPSLGLSTSSLASKRNFLEQIAVTDLSNLTLDNKTNTLFLNQNTGHVYKLNQNNEIERQSYTTINSINKAYWGYQAGQIKLLLRQNLGLEVKNYWASFTPPTKGEQAELNLTPWSTEILDFTVSPNKQKIAYLIKKGSGSELYTSDWSNSKPQQVWSSPLKDWLITWPETDSVVIVSKASHNYAGTAYLLNLKNKQSKQVLSNINGLTVSVGPNGEDWLYTKSLLGSFSLYHYNTKNDSVRLLDINTLAEKCVWQDSQTVYCATPKNISAGRYPDDWYQGKISFTDNIKRLDLQNKTSKIVAEPKGDYDLINLTINQETGWLYTKDKKDKVLQVFNLED